MAARFISDISGLRTALDGKASAGDLKKVASEIADKADKNHGHSIADVTGLSAVLNGKAALRHNHDVADIIGLSTAISEAIGDLVVPDELTDLDTTVTGAELDAMKSKLDLIEDNAKDDQTPAEILAALLTVDGPASGLDADLLDGNHASAFLLASEKGAANGVAELVGGTVPSAQLPSYVDDVIEVANFAALPITGESGKIYITIDDGKTYRWSGSAYAEISSSLALGETSSTAYRGDRGKAAYDHSLLASGNPHGVTKSDVGLGNADNTSDVNKPVSTATQTALDGKANTAHSHAISDVTSLQSTLDGKAASSHTHSTSDVTGLDTALAGKAATSHSHAASDITSGTLAAARLPVAGATTIGGVMRNAGATGEYVNGFDSTGAAIYGTPVSGYRPNMNAIRNGGFRLAQRGELFTAIADGAYCFDGWYVLSDGAGVVDVGRNYSSGLGEVGLTVKIANKKFGLAQIIEGQDIQDLKSAVATLSFLARRTVAGGGPLGFKGVVLQWVGTEDIPTKDFVSAWGVSGADPSFVTNWSVIGTVSASGSESGTSVPYARTVDQPSVSATNLAVFFYITNSAATAINDQVVISDVQLEPGAVATSFQRRPINEEFTRCQRYYEVLRYTNTSGLAAVDSFRAASTYAHQWYFKVTKRVVPTVSNTLVTGSWSGGAPNIVASVDHAYLTRTTNFAASGTAGAIALAADAELGV